MEGLMAKISFDVSATDALTIRKIVKRACADDARLVKLDLTMDLTATHANGNPLDLERLLTVDDFNFYHDIYGIIRHLDRETGKLTGHFSPRLSKRIAA